MKNIKMKTLTILLFALSLSVTIAKAEDFVMPDNSPSLLEEANHLFIALISNAQYLEMETMNISAEVAEESEMFMEESLEMEEWMLDFKWVEKEEVISEKELSLELWMESPKNWNASSGK